MARKATASIKFDLQVGHHLPDHKGRCKAPHGHRLQVKLYVRRKIDPETHLSIDFYDLKKYVKKIDDMLDHKYLNDLAGIFPALGYPTSEEIAHFLWDYLEEQGLEGITKIKIAEGTNTAIRISKKDR